MPQIEAGSILPALTLLAVPTAPPGVKVWQLPLPALGEPDDAQWAMLTPDEHTRCLRYRQRADQLRFALTRLALRQLLAGRLGVTPLAVPLVAGPHGKPMLGVEGLVTIRPGADNMPAASDADSLIAAGAAWPFFNVSHAGDYALIALSDHCPVGVDIEAQRALDLTELVHGVFSAAERAHCASGSDAAAFYAIWAGKEAVLKAWGVGIGDDMDAMSALPHAEGHYVLAASGQVGEVDFAAAAPATRAWVLPVPAGYAGALALWDQAADTAGD
ncbi:4'-phosphopantetheinyl transferase sfp [Andreprevotia sp. IGB-42]|uniref:4'-phosphopantetheinyl transferase family protein n=1 Tax=Andreprevotia sp. IGB-42 TaxID=2497473 RepID=UPI00135C008D|nr:4'-phosphopantetheinyl transferase superfamily protein [Andreprevotia sp. IGB-42]KAF0812691.1 4'-phosphopantetheinyl transferase sfp [Andreprevotia sp. IGB-42]